YRTTRSAAGAVRGATGPKAATRDLALLRRMAQPVPRRSDHGVKRPCAIPSLTTGRWLSRPQFPLVPFLPANHPHLAVGRDDTARSADECVAFSQWSAVHSFDGNVEIPSLRERPPHRRTKTMFRIRE